MNGHLGQIDQRLDKIESRLDNLEQCMETAEEGQTEIRTSVNVLTERSENAGYIIKYPLTR